METHPPRDISRSQSVQDKVFTSVTIDRVDCGVGNVSIFFIIVILPTSIFELNIITIWPSVVCLISKIKNFFFTLIYNNYQLVFVYQWTLFLMWGAVNVEFLTFNLKVFFLFKLLVFSKESFCFLRQKICFRVCKVDAEN